MSQYLVIDVFFIDAVKWIWSKMCKMGAFIIKQSNRYGGIFICSLLSILTHRKSMKNARRAACAMTGLASMSIDRDLLMVSTLYT